MTEFLPKVIDQTGKPVVGPEMESVTNLVIQLAQLAQLAKMRRLEESKVPVGVKPIKVTVPDSIMKIAIDPPWISFSLINDNPVATPYGVTVWVNSEEDPLVEGMIAYGENYNCNMEYPIIHTLYLKAESGTTVPVRIYGKEGRR